MSKGWTPLRSRGQVGGRQVMGEVPEKEEDRGE